MRWILLGVVWLWSNLHKGHTLENLVDETVTYGRQMHQHILHQTSDTQFQGYAGCVRAAGSLLVQNGLSRMAVGAQLGYTLHAVPEYKKSIFNTLKDRYGGSTVRASNLLFHNLFATQFLNYGQHLHPLLFGIGVGAYGALCTPFEALLTHKTDSICQWRQGGCIQPLSYFEVIKKQGFHLFKGASLNALIYGTSWPIFMQYINIVRDVDFESLPHAYPLNLSGTLVHSGVWAGLEVIFLNPLFVLQRHMQKDPTVHTNVRKTIQTLAEKEGIKAFYKGSTSFFAAVFFSTVVDLVYLQYLWAREHTKYT